MKRGFLTMDKINQLRGPHSFCPICGNPFPYNPRSGSYGQWAHFICSTKDHIRRYGMRVVNSTFNGCKVCSLKCNNSVQLKYGSQPVLCDQLAEDIRTREGLCIS